MSDIVQRVAMKAVIVKDGKVLILREAKTYDEGTNHGRYHFPGGRVEPGENFEQALKREVREETGLEVELDYPVYVGEWQPVIKGVPHQIVATFIVCKPTSDSEIVLSSEHDDFKWIEPSERAKYDLMPPDDLVVDAYAARR
jgi:8-oxo-dGTP diphosphatase